MILPLINIVLGIMGFSIALHIFHKKARKAVLVCPIGSDCNAVVHSAYSKFFGIAVERVGMVYYFLITVFYGIALFVQPLTDGVIHFFMLGMTLGAFLFSIYLVCIQGFVIKQWCTWCLGSAVVATGIFLANFIFSNAEMSSYLLQFKGVIVLIHAVSASIGLGAAFTTDFLFFKFIKDKKISLEEKKIMDSLSHVLWFAIGCIILTGIGIYAPQATALNHLPKFLVKAIAVAVIVINGFVLNVVISPRLTKIDFGTDQDDTKILPVSTRRLSFALGAISISSWFTAFILGAVRNVYIPFTILLCGYAGIVVIAIFCSQLFAHYVRTK
ncbi:MAG: vitamin K epoxide reductase family protein [Candidatus Pacebacteria bacterium]|nr:vitamin K epoxide reductase family protein [Candidatus Paceibacterota bacterium]